MHLAILYILSSASVPSSQAGETPVLHDDGEQTHPSVRIGLWRPALRLLRHIQQAQAPQVVTQRGLLPASHHECA